jgi:RHS repeat-associated protein
LSAQPHFHNRRLRTGLKLQQPTGVWTNGFGYDLAKRLTGVTSPAGAFNYAYDPARLRLPVSLSLPNTSYITNRYDGNARLLSTRLLTSGASVLDEADYGYNLGNQRTTFTNAAAIIVNFAYDKIGQLKVADSTVNTEDRGYLYDAAWNLNRRTNGPSALFSVDGKNQLTSVGAVNYTYDDNGNLTSQADIHTGTIYYTYDDENQLTSATTGTGANPPYTSFVYDGLGRLREQLSYVWYGGSGGGGGSSARMGGAMTQSSGGGGSGSGYQLNGGKLYIYDGHRVIQERDTNNTPTVSYTRGNDFSGSLEGAGGIGGLLARSEGYYAGNFSSHAFYHADGNGNITYLEDGSQALAASYRYDAFGNLLNSNGPLAGDNTYRFSSKEWIPSVNGYYYLYRFYRPDLQRWLNRDPIQEWGGINLYGFAVNNPMFWVDLFGFGPIDGFPGILGGPSTPSWQSPSMFGSLFSSLFGLYQDLKPPYPIGAVKFDPFGGNPLKPKPLIVCPIADGWSGKLTVDPKVDFDPRHLDLDPSHPGVSLQISGTGSRWQFGIKGDYDFGSKTGTVFGTGTVRF